jgi:hypothetical protein
MRHLAITLAEDFSDSDLTRLSKDRQLPKEAFVGYDFGRTEHFYTLPKLSLSKPNYSAATGQHKFSRQAQTGLWHASMNTAYIHSKADSRPPERTSHRGWSLVQIVYELKLIWPAN